MTTRDLLVRIYVKKTPGSVAYRAVRIARTDFPVLTCAASPAGRPGAPVRGRAAGQSSWCWT